MRLAFLLIRVNQASPPQEIQLRRVNQRLLVRPVSRRLAIQLRQGSPPLRASRLLPVFQVSQLQAILKHLPLPAYQALLLHQVNRVSRQRRGNPLLGIQSQRDNLGNRRLPVSLYNRPPVILGHQASQGQATQRHQDSPQHQGSLGSRRQETPPRQANRLPVIRGYRLNLVCRASLVNQRQAILPRRARLVRRALRLSPTHPIRQWQATS